MKVNVRPLNKGETFCCSVKSAKEAFKDTEVTLNFGYNGRIYETFAETPDAYYMKKNIKGRILSSMYAHSGVANSLLSFFVVKESEYSNDLKKEFEEKYISDYYDFYMTLLNKKDLIMQTQMMLIELYDKKLIVHKPNLKWK